MKFTNRNQLISLCTGKQIFAELSNGYFVLITKKSLIKTLSTIVANGHLIKGFASINENWIQITFDKL